MTTGLAGIAQRVAVVGSRGYTQLGRVRDYVKALPAGTVVVSGGARGVDREAGVAAIQAGLQIQCYRPDYDKHGKRAPLVRNRLIVDDCDRLVAFWDGKSTGTMHAVGLANKAGKAVEIFAEITPPAYLEHIEVKL